MTTHVTVTNMNEGLPFADWSIVVQYEDANTASRATATTLKPGESGEFDLWHDGRALMIRELPK